MAIAFVSATNGENITGSSVTTVATSATMNVAAGAFLIAGVKLNGTVSGITDGGSNSFAYLGTATNASSGIKVEMWVKENATANATATWTATFSSGTYPGMVVLQFSGVATGSSLDVSNFTGQADALFTVTSGSFLPGQTNEVVVAFAQDNGNGGVWTADGAGGYTTHANAVSGTAHEVFGQWNITVAASPQTVSAVNDLGTYKSLAVATFLEASGGGGAAGIGGFKSLLGVGR